MSEKIVVIGAGNVAHHLVPALLCAGHDVCQIYSRSEASAIALSKITGLPYTTKIDDIYREADIYIITISDDVIGGMAKLLKCPDKALVLHTAGSVHAAVLAAASSRYGVIYPLQTFTKGRDLNFAEIPLFIEGSSSEVLKQVRAIAESISNIVTELPSDKRKAMHLAAVWACNFANHMYAVGGKILAENGLDFSLLRPLIAETADKVMEMLPVDAQTGPARRKDKGVIGMHRELMKGKHTRLSLYNSISDSIAEMCKVANSEKQEPEEENFVELTLW
ncbi:MAG: DUF2520 domain-containing protein [Marinifilaceae bacterium]|nr:DUF2520 domain-containing protein [Marinifilaceae bacterium]